MNEGDQSRSWAMAARGVWLLGALIILLVTTVVGLALWLDQPSGKAFLLRQIPRLHLQSGLTIGIGKVDGSLFNTLTIHNLELGDPKGIFVRIPVVEVDWRPRDLLENRLTINRARAAEIDLLRLPHFNPTSDPRLLPDIDITVGALDIGKLTLEPAVTGHLQTISLKGRTDIRAGRVLLDLDANAPIGGDTAHIKLDAEPDRDRFDIDAMIHAPIGGVLEGMAGFGRPIDATITGDGSWTNWRGKIAATSGPNALAHILLTADKGSFAINGTLNPNVLLSGPAQRLTAPQVNIQLQARLAKRAVQTVLHLDSPAIVIDVNGLLDFANERLVDVNLDARLLKPAAVHPQFYGRDIHLAAKIAGTFVNPLIDYGLTAAEVGYRETRLIGARVTGIVKLGARPLIVPVAASAQRVLGVGDTAEPLLKNVRLEGPLQFSNGSLMSDALVLRSDRLSGRATVTANLASGAFGIGLKSILPRYAIPGTAIADLDADLRISGASAGITVSGSATAVVTQLENAGIATLLGGNPRLNVTLDMAPDISLHVGSFRLVAPSLTVNGSGHRSAGGIIQFSGLGVSRDYGPVSFDFAGTADKPVVNLALASPGLGIGIANVRARIAPSAAGWSIGATAVSNYGDIVTEGVVRSGGGPLTIDLTRLVFAGLQAHGTAVATHEGPFSGRFGITGAGVTGSVLLSATGAAQRFDADLDANNARLSLDQAVSIGSGHISAVGLFPETGAPSVKATVKLAKVRRAENELTNLTVDVAYADRMGHAKVSANGYAGSPFALDAAAQFSSDQISVSGKGQIDGRVITLDHTAVLTRHDGDWVLAPTTMLAADGRASISGTFGRDFALNAQLDRIGLSLLGVINPALDFTGTLSGVVDLKFPADGALPTGTASLRVNGLSRAGFATASSRIDLGINATIANGSASARAVIARGGRIEGRAQAVLPVIPGGRADPLLTRLLASPLTAQLRWSGPAQALWPLSGVQAIDVRGPVTIAADIGGVLGDPDFSGTIGAEGARVENTAIGLVIDKISLASRFSQSRLDVNRFTGAAGKDGMISGSGSIDLSAVRNFPLDFKLDLKNALLLNRDDLHLSATGPVHIENGKDGAKISGKLNIDRARVVIGGASVEDVPVLAVTEINRDTTKRAALPVTKPTIWQLALELHANNKVDVRGMGLDSEWSGDLKVGGSATAPQLVGKVQLVRGDYDFAGKRFTLTRGDVRFAGGYPPDPTINIQAENTSSSLTATLSITGTALRPQIAFSSVPSLPEDEVLSRVLFGESITNLSAPEALQLAAALGTLRGGSGGLNPINMVRKGLGIDRLRILPADAVKGRKTSIAAGEYIGDRVYVEVTSDAQGYNATSVEVSLTRSLSILSEIASLGGGSVNLRWKRDY